MPTNHDAVAALPVTLGANKALLRAMATRRFVYCLDVSENATDFVAVDPDAGTIPLYLLQNSILFQYDPLDTTTPNDGVTCLVSSDGKRYKLEDITAFIGLLAFSDISGLILPSQLPTPSAATLGGVKSLAAVAHKWINQIGTDGEPSATQPAASDLSNGTTGSNVVVLGTGPTIAGPTISGGTIGALTSFGIRSTAASFDLLFASAEAITASRTVTWSLSNANRAISLNGDVNLGGALTLSGAFGFTGTLTGTTGVTFPTTGTLATIAGAETPINKTFNAANNTVSNLTTAMFAVNVVDTDGTLAANSDSRLASQKAVKSYVDAFIQGISAKYSALCATTAALAANTYANGTLGVGATLTATGNGALSVDGQSPAVGQYVLVKNEAAGANNGLFIVTQAGDVSHPYILTRAVDDDVAAEMAGAFCFVELGTVNGKTGWICAQSAITIGSTAITFTQFSGAGTYSAGTGLTLTGSVFAIDATVATLTGSQALTNKTYNGLTLTSTTGTLTLAAGKTATINNTLTFSGTDGSSIAFGTGGTVTYTANNLSVFASTTSAQLAGVISDETGTGALVFGTSPSLVTPSLGVATATSINKMAITAPATGSTLAVADGKTLTASNTLTLTGTDGSSVGFGTGGTVAYTANNLSVFAATTSAQLAGVISDETGTGVLVFGTGPTLSNPAVGTQTFGNNSTLAASTAFVQAAISGATAGVASLGGATGTITLGAGLVMASNVLSVDGAFGYRNRAINPYGLVNQLPLGSTADGSYTGFDQWLALTQSNPVTSSQLTNVENGTPYMMRLTQANASAQRFGLIQPLESANCIDMRGQTVTLSARVRMSASTTLRYAVVEWQNLADSPTKDVVNDWTNATFTPGNFFISSGTAVVGAGSTALTANTPTTISVSGTVSGSMNNLHLFFWTDSTQAQNVTLDVSRVNFEIAAVATPVAFRPAATELLLSQRYLKTFVGAGSSMLAVGLANSTTLLLTPFAFNPPMFKAPTGVILSATSDWVNAPSGNAFSAFVLTGATTTQARLDGTTTGMTANNAVAIQASNTSARLSFDARM